MKYQVLLVFFIAGFACGEDDTDDVKKFDNNDNCDDWDNDDSKYIYEPCDYSDGVDCVQKFFRDHSSCSITHCPNNKPVYRKKHVNRLPSINSELITTGDRLTNIEGQIVTFYINKKSNNLVMAVNFEDYTIVSKKLYLIVNRRGREPAVAADYGNGTQSFTATAIIPLHHGKVEMDKARITSYIPNGFTYFYFGPKITNSADPDISRAIAGLYADVATAMKEYFVTEGASVFLAYFQKYICDFGIPLYN